jgi:hypothetical protein
MEYLRLACGAPDDLSRVLEVVVQLQLYNYVWILPAATVRARNRCIHYQA